MIEVEGISKTYVVPCRERNRRRGILAKKRTEEVRALDKVSFTVNKGEIFGILGPNGAGKTTLIKVIAGLLFPDEGSASVNGFDVIKDRERVRTSINLLRSGGWIAYDYKLSLFNNLKYWGVVGGLRWHEVDGRVKDALETIGLGDRLNDYPEDLSAGMRQKMCLAHCLLLDRPVYLLDEPTANIDPYSANFIREFIKEELAGKGKTVILATHNLWEAEMLCDKILILNKGTSLVSGSTEEIRRTHGADRLVIEVKEPSAELIEKLFLLPYVKEVFVDTVGFEEEKEVYQLRIYGDLRADIPPILWACAEHTKVGNVELKESALNDIFMTLIGREEDEE